MSGTLSRRAFVRRAAATGLGAGIAGNAAARTRRAKAT
ncbi:MAG: hypothetical protein JWM73_1120, partial [Solirubrobacterales bacterium]|nr:hypothetical protein [Solirubrobacterales bacterium]